jgi:hypothetical protein
LAAFAAALALAVSLAACGGGGEGQSASAGSSPAESAGGLLRGDGERADKAELGQAARTLRRFLNTVAARRWKTACAEMANSTVARLEKVAANSKLPKDCPAALAKLAGVRSARSLKADARRADVRSLRVNGDRAVVVYRSHEGVRLAMPMVREGGAWRPVALIGTQVG